MNNRVKRFNQFLEFVLNHKLPKMVKKMSNEELVDLYQQYSPRYFTAENNILNTRNSSMVLCAVVEELKHRHPNNPKFKDYNYQYDLKLI